MFIFIKIRGAHVIFYMRFIFFTPNQRHMFQNFALIHATGITLSPCPYVQNSCMSVSYLLTKKTCIQILFLMSILHNSIIEFFIFNIYQNMLNHLVYTNNSTDYSFELSYICFDLICTTVSIFTIFGKI